MVVKKNNIKSILGKINWKCNEKALFINMNLDVIPTTAGFGEINVVPNTLTNINLAG